MNYIGKTSGGIDVEIGAASPNQHVVISGMSGAGKSVRLAEIEKNIIQYGGTVIAFDVNGTHKREENAAFNFISVQEDGLDVKFLNDKLVKRKRNVIKFNPICHGNTVSTRTKRSMSVGCSEKSNRVCLRSCI